MSYLVPVAALVGLGSCCSAYFQPWRTSWATRFRYVLGFALFVNYGVFWAPAFVIMGGLYKQCLAKYMLPYWERVEEYEPLRRFAAEYIYELPRSADYFASAVLSVTAFLPALVFVWFWQLRYNSLPWWVIIMYNLFWVGLGGRTLGAVYATSHREGHSAKFYKPWIRNTVGNFFENWAGTFYGGVPHNFETTHLSLHHRLDGGLGDPFYFWDLQRGSMPDFCVYLARGAVMQMSGFGGFIQFMNSPRKYDRQQAFKLARGLLYYWGLVPVAVIWLTGSVEFYFWIVLQPFCSMTTFLTLLNSGFHAFIENDADGKRISCVESTNFLGGLDDYWGEDDHMAHHNYGHVYYRDLPEHHRKQQAEWAKYKASVFQGFDVASFSFIVLLKGWPVLADRFIDYSGEMTKEDIASMLESRARRIEMKHTCWMPPLPKTKAVGYISHGAPEEEDEGSASYRAVIEKLGAFQLWLAYQVQEGCVPIQPRETFIKKQD